MGTGPDVVEMGFGGLVLKSIERKGSNKEGCIAIVA